MTDISVLLQCLSFCVDSTTLCRLEVIVLSVLSMTGRVTMLGISRWSDAGGSYRTIQRFYTSSINWAKVHYVFIRHCLFQRAEDQFV